ncbi:MAG TPA: PDZ domain-containing protein [Terriglobales bacterium]|nr:PDZ domain-containing protein [Terriglobales bacterium]
MGGAPLTAFAAEPERIGGLRRHARFGAVVNPPEGRAGASVGRVDEGTVAAQAGLRRGDLILRVNGTLLDSLLAFDRAFVALRGGDTARLEVLRNGQTFERTVTLPPMPLQTFSGIDVAYDSVVAENGLRFRTIIARPKNATGRLPGLFLAGWLSCDSVEVPVGPKGGIEKLLDILITQSGFVMMRMDKPGIGDSEGYCSQADFQTELAGYRAAMRAFKALDYVDAERIYIFGDSNGAAYAPLIGNEAGVRGYVVSGGWAKTWLEHMLELERRRLALMGQSPGDITEKLRGYSEFYSAYYNQKLTPAEVIRQKPHLAGLWYDAPEHQYGRPASFYQQLQDLNIAGAWSRVSVPTLSIYGEYDWFMSADDHQTFAALVNRNRPGAGRYVMLPKTNHGFNVYDSPEKEFRGEGGRFNQSVGPLILDWLKEQNTAGK